MPRHCNTGQTGNRFCTPDRPGPPRWGPSRAVLVHASCRPRVEPSAQLRPPSRILSSPNSPPVWLSGWILFPKEAGWSSSSSRLLPRATITDHQVLERTAALPSSYRLVRFLLGETCAMLPRFNIAAVRSVCKTIMSLCFFRDVYGRILRVKGRGCHHLMLWYQLLWVHLFGHFALLFLSFQLLCVWPFLVPLLPGHTGSLLDAEYPNQAGRRNGLRLKDNLMPLRYPPDTSPLVLPGPWASHDPKRHQPNHRINVRPHPAPPPSPQTASQSIASTINSH